MRKAGNYTFKLTKHHVWINVRNIPPPTATTPTRLPSLFILLRAVFCVGSDSASASRPDTWSQWHVVAVAAAAAQHPNDGVCVFVYDSPRVPRIVCLLCLACQCLACQCLACQSASSCPRVPRRPSLLARASLRLASSLVADASDQLRACSTAPGACSKGDLSSDEAVATRWR